MDISTVLTETGTSDFTCFDSVLNHYSILHKYIVSLEEGAANNVPILVGNNKDENGIDLTTFYNVTEDEETTTSSYREYAAEPLDLHPANTTAAATNAYNAILRARYCTSTRSFANRWSKTSGTWLFVHRNL
ncbi:hypothetical protein PENPOL_c012G04660 [Penicillium polonicum]|uniref:Uncharacterized protein n=1 Tax=Penicillium polonicum TaxID=60169 RepID=A0A1V6NDI8_PENPO|nr:hypothetical protein PENPOL_c012G04660 [Penicillium polonicum]